MSSQKYVLMLIHGTSQIDLRRIDDMQDGSIGVEEVLSAIAKGDEKVSAHWRGSIHSSVISFSVFLQSLLEEESAAHTACLQVVSDISESVSLKVRKSVISTIDSSFKVESVVN